MFCVNNIYILHITRNNLQSPMVTINKLKKLKKLISKYISVFHQDELIIEPIVRKDISKEPHDKTIIVGTNILQNVLKYITKNDFLLYDKINKKYIANNFVKISLHNSVYLQIHNNISNPQFQLFSNIIRYFNNLSVFECGKTERLKYSRLYDPKTAQFRKLTVMKTLKNASKSEKKPTIQIWFMSLFEALHQNLDASINNNELINHLGGNKNIPNVYFMALEDGQNVDDKKVYGEGLANIATAGSASEDNITATLFAYGAQIHDSHPMLQQQYKKTGHDLEMEAILGRPLIVTFVLIAKKNNKIISRFASSAILAIDPKQKRIQNNALKEKIKNDQSFEFKIKKEWKKQYNNRSFKNIYKNSNLEENNFNKINIIKKLPKTRTVPIYNTQNTNCLKNNNNKNWIEATNDYKQYLNESSIQSKYSPFKTGINDDKKFDPTHILIDNYLKRSNELMSPDLDRFCDFTFMPDNIS